jgi:hypothetical protein
MVLGTTAAPAAASVTLGQIGPPAGCMGGYDDIPALVSSGNSYVVPASGRIISWTTYAGPSGGQVTMKVFRKVLSPATFEVVGHSGPRALVPNGISGNTFPANIAVQPGDVLGVYGGCFFVAPDEYFYREGSLGDGETDSFDRTNGVRWEIQAEFVPNTAPDTAPDSGFMPSTNAFSFVGKPRRNKRKGTATLIVDLPGPGTLALTGKGIVGQSAAAAQARSAASQLKLTVRTKGKKKRALKRKGKVKVVANVTYTPTGGSSNTQSQRLKLIKRR